MSQQDRGREVHRRLLAEVAADEQERASARARVLEEASRVTGRDCARLGRWLQRLGRSPQP